MNREIMDEVIHQLRLVHIRLIAVDLTAANAVLARIDELEREGREEREAEMAAWRNDMETFDPYPSVGF